MDPDEALRRLRAAVAKREALAAEADRCAYGDSNDEEFDALNEIREAYEAMVDSFTALDEWITRGGFPPLPWRGGRN